MRIGTRTVWLFSAVLLVGSTAAEATQVAAFNPVTSGNNNFTFLLPGTSCPASGCVVDGANDVAFSWDGTVFTSSNDYTGPGGASNATLASSRPIMAINWTIHDMQVFGAGSYSFNAALGGGTPETGTLGMTVGANQLGAHLLMDWNANLNMDIVMVWDKNTTFGPQMFTTDANPAGNSLSTMWMLSSTDADGDGMSGINMAPNGPFTYGGLSAGMNFNLKGTLVPVPVPAAAWLLGSGLLGLLGVARRRMA